jgi:hypothetical protein
MSFSFSTAVRAGVTSMIAFGMLNAAFARERGPRVEVVCPSPPVPVRIDKQQVLVYELHVTNFDVVPLTLKRLDVFGNDENSRPLITLADDRLAAAMIQVGAPMASADSSAGPKDARVIGPGGRAVVFLWTEMQPDHPSPISLRHRMVFSSAAADGGNAAEATLDDFPVPVSQDSVLTLSPPFNGGIWLAGNGPANDSDHRRSITAIDGHIYSAERFAIDWIKVGPNGDSRHDGSTRNENWWGYGEPVLAVADGEIMEVVDGIPDNTPRVLPPVTLDNIAGNHVILQIAPNRYVAYAHLQNQSIRVKLHDRVHRGAVLALLGNSGNTTGAHLHLQVTDRNSVLQSEGVPFVFGSFIYLGPGSDYPEKQVAVPWSNSIPPGNAVVKFEPSRK